MPKEYISKLSKSLDFYKKSYYFLLYTAILLGIIILGVVTFAIYRHINIPAQQYFATTSDGTIVELFDVRANKK